MSPPFPRPRKVGRRALTLTATIGAISTGLVVSVFGPAVVIAPLAAAAAGWVWLRMPGVLFGAYLFLPFYKAALGPLSPVDLTPLLAVANATQVVLLMGAREPVQGSRLGLVLWIVLGVVILSGVMWAEQQGLAIDRASYWWALILLPTVAAVRVTSRSRFVDQFLATGSVVGCAVVVLGLPNVFGLARLAVIGENTIMTGAITLIFALLSVFWILRKAPPWARPAGFVLIVVALVESVASGSRGPLLAFMIAIAFGFASRVVSRRPITRHDLGLAALASTAIVALVLAISRLPGQSIARLLQLGDVVVSGGPVGTSIAARLDLFSLATQMFVNHPVLGNGTGAFAAYTTVHTGLQQFTYPHNDLLQLAAEFGMVGAALFVALVSIAMVRRIPATAQWKSVKVVFVLMLVLSLISGDIYGDRLLWGLLVLILSVPGAVAVTEPVVAPVQGRLPGTRVRHRGTTADAWAPLR